MKRRTYFPPGARLLNLSELVAELDRLSRSLVGLSGPEFEAQYVAGKLTSANARVLASGMLAIIQGVRKRDAVEQAA